MVILGAAPGERSAARMEYRAGCYERGLVTRVGKIELRVPRSLGRVLDGTIADDVGNEEAWCNRSEKDKCEEFARRMNAPETGVAVLALALLRRRSDAEPE